MERPSANLYLNLAGVLRTLAILLLWMGLMGCADGIVLQNPERFQQEIVGQDTTPPEPPKKPENAVQYVQYELIENRKLYEYAKPVGGILFILFLLRRFFSLLYRLTTTSPTGR
jgi:hypothetical protein